MKPHILIDGHMIGQNEGGNERYTRNLIKHLTKIADVGVLCYKSISFLKTHIIPKNDIFRLIYIPFLMVYQKYTILHSNYILPFFKFPQSRYVITVHDLSFKRFPSLFNLRERFIFSTLFPYSLWLCDTIIVPSNYIKHEFEQLFPYLKKKITVTYEGIDSVFCIKAPVVDGQKFFLCISSKSSRKNIELITKAFLDSCLADTYLYVVGPTQKHKEPEVSGKIKYLGYVGDKKLNTLYNNAIALIYFSSYEGFGLPIIEALSLNVPVIASDIPPHREIGRIFPYYVKLNDQKKLTETMQKVAFLKKRETSKRIHSLYNWNKTAKKTISVYKSLLQISA